MPSTSKPHARRVLICVTVLIGAFAPGRAQAADTSPAAPSGEGQYSPYCGLFSVYATVRMYGGQVDFKRDLLRPEYIGSTKGSSLAELKLAATNNGLHAEAVSGLTPQTLQRTPHPIILHAKQSLHDKQYNHFLLLLPGNGSEATVLDAPQPVRQVKWDELLPVLDGTGVVLSPAPIALGEVFAPSRAYYALCAVTVLVLAGGMKWALNRLYASRVATTGFMRRPGLRGPLEAVGVTAVVTVCALLFNAQGASGLLANTAAVSAIQDLYATSFLDKVDIGELRRALDRKDAVIVDARYQPDYADGHVPTALNVQPNLSEAQFLDATRTIPKDARIIVYCMSAGCDFDEKVARQLVLHGYTKIKIFHEGWTGWEASPPKKAS